MGERRLKLLFLAVTLIGVVPIASVHYVPAVDLPQHVMVATLLSPNYQAAHQAYLQADWVLSPYALFYLVMQPLLFLVAHVTAANLVMAMYVIIWPLSIYVFARHFMPHAWWTVFLTFPFVYNYPFEYGFIAFVLGLPFVFLGWVLFDRIMTERHASVNVTLSVLVAVAIYLSHLVNVIAFSVGLIVLMIHRREYLLLLPAFRLRWRVWISLAVAYLPIPIMMLLYVIGANGDIEHSVAIRRMWHYASIGHQLKTILAAVVTHDMETELMLVGTLLAVVVGLLITKKARLRLGFPFYLGVALFVVGMIIPRASFLGSFEQPARILIMAYIAALISVEVVASWRWLPITAGIAAYAFILLWRVDYYREVDRATEDYVSAVEEFIPAGQRIWAIQVMDPESRLPPLLHTISYYHLDKGGVSPNLFFWSPHVNGLRSSYNFAARAEWLATDTNLFSKYASKFDYMVVSSYQAPLPRYFARFADNRLYADSVVAIYRLDSAIVAPKLATRRPTLTKSSQ